MTPRWVAAWTVARLTVREMVRRRLFLAGTLVTAAFLALYGFGLYKVREDMAEALVAGQGYLWSHAQALGAALRVVGLYLSALLVSLLAALTGAGTLQAEVESGLLQAVAARPVSRLAILLGKFAGCALVAVAYALALFAAVTLLAWRLVLAPLEGAVAGAAIFALIPLVVLALTFALASRLPTLPTAAAVTLLVGMAMVGGMLEQIGVAAQMEGLQRAGVASSLILPTDALYRRVAALTVGKLDFGPFSLLVAAGPLGAASVPSPWAVVYAALYATAALAVAAWQFCVRDL